VERYNEFILPYLKIINDVVHSRGGWFISTPTPDVLCSIRLFRDGESDGITDPALHLHGHPPAERKNMSRPNFVLFGGLNVADC
jgi:hypothetical protein